MNGGDVMKKERKEDDFWLFFLRDPLTRVIYCTGHRHNAIADYRNNYYFIGMKKISVRLENLEQ
jgi:hypothetical protein